ncbi:MAG: ABC transporter permease [Planctomycetota bacterium]|nr:ABC transporter permease [Planctomycetota bacterium]
MLLSTMRRESRGSRGRLLFFVLCLAVGVAAVTGVGSLVATLRDGIRANSRALLAADVEVSARRPLPAEALGDFLATRPALRFTGVRELATVVSSTEDVLESRLAELKVVDGDFPFYGELVLDPPGRLADALGPDRLVAAPELLDALGLRVGDALQVGGVPFEIAAVVVDEPGRLGFSLALGPRVFLSAEGLERTALLGVGNRVRHKGLLAVRGLADGRTLNTLVSELQAALPDSGFLRFETHTQAQPTLRRALGRVEDYLGLVALLSLLLGGVGVAQIVRAWIGERTASIAVLRCLGLRPREVLLLYLTQVASLAFVGSAVGAALGASLPWVLAAAMPELLPGDLLTSVPLEPLLRGLGLGLGVALLFSLPPLTAVYRVPPARVLRADAAPLPAPRALRWVANLVLLLGIFGASWLQSDDLERAAVFSVGMALTVGLLMWAARGLMRVSGRLPRERLHPVFKHGLAALSRPGAGTVGAVVALGLGVLVVLAMVLVEGRMDAELRSALPENAPSVFLVDIQSDQWADVQGALEQAEASAVDSVPVVMARLSSIEGEPVSERLARSMGGTVRGTTAQGSAPPSGTDTDGGFRESEGGRRGGGRRSRHWVLTREQRLTWLEELPEDNRILEGELWSHPDRAEVSLEEDYAEDLGVSVGSTLVFDVLGRPVELLVSSTRSVEWGSFSINFFVVVEPGVLEQAPHFRIASARIPADQESLLQGQLAVAHPNVTMLRVRNLLEKAAEILARLGFGVRLLGAFTALAGIVILAGAVASTSLRRAREVALLKTLGLTRRGVIVLFATEYALGGLTAGLVGGLGAYALAWGFLEQVLELGAELPWMALPLAGVCGALLATVAGLAASLRALAVRPVESLRA